MTLFGWGNPRYFPRLPQPTVRYFDVDHDARVLAHCHWQPRPWEHPTIVALHGLNGSSDAHYMKGIAAKAFARGMNAVRLNQRNCGNTEHLSAGLFHSGLTADVKHVVEELIAVDRLPSLGVAGYSLGGNLAQRPRCPYFRSELFHCRKKGGTECFAIPGENQEHAVFGNGLCAIVHPSGAATALVALGASLKLKGPRGERTLPIEQFFVRPEHDVTRENVLQPGELIVEVRVPAGRRGGYVKLMQKQTFDWPLADAAVVLDLDGGTIREARVVLGAAAPVPWRASAVEKALVGKKLDESSARAAAIPLHGERRCGGRNNRVNYQPLTTNY